MHTRSDERAAWRSGAPRSQREVRAYQAACARLGLAPSTRPLVLVRRNGTVTFRATAQAADELAVLHGLHRELEPGPRVLVAANAKPLACAVCRATRRDGHQVSAMAAAPLDAEGLALMTCETRARRLATLRVLGLDAFAGEDREWLLSGYAPVEMRVLLETRGAGLASVAALRDEGALAELPMTSVAMRAEPMAALAMKPVETRSVSVGGEARALVQTLWDPRAASADVSPVRTEAEGGAESTGVLERFYVGCARLATRDEAVALWLARRGEIAPLSSEARGAAWSALVARVRVFASPGTSAAAAGDWLKRAIKASERAA